MGLWCLQFLKKSVWVTVFTLLACQVCLAEWKYEPIDIHYGEAWSRLPREEVLKIFDHPDHFYYYWRKQTFWRSKKAVHEMNQKDLDELAKDWFMKGKTDRPDFMTREDAQALFNFIKNHPVAGLDMVDHYDPHGNIQFCFGKAFATHIASLHAGLDPDSVRKVFAVGRMGKWSFHVATMVKAHEGGYWVIDPLLDRPMMVYEWMEYWENRYRNAKMRFYYTEGDRFAYSVPDYSRVNLGLDLSAQADFYNNYFKDFLDNIVKPENRVGLPELNKRENNQPFYDVLSYYSRPTVYRSPFFGGLKCEVHFKFLKERGR